MRFQRTVLSIAASVALASLTGCGGGGSGGLVVRPDANLVSVVSFQTPKLIGTVDPLQGDSYVYSVSDTYVAPISGSGQDLIVAGRSTAIANPGEWRSSNIHMFSWQNGVLVDKTAQWFPNDINVITGFEPGNLQFADLFKSGRVDMIIAPYSDYVLANSGPAYVFTNNGSSFSRQSIDLNGAEVHGATIADLNLDTYQDILFIDANGSNTTLAINDRVSSFVTYRESVTSPGTGIQGNAVTVGDFLNNGTTTLITTDNYSSAGHVQKLWGYSITGNQVVFTELSVLPTSRFNTPAWQALGVLDSHNIRILTHDFSDDGVSDAIVFSTPGTMAIQPGQSTGTYSEIQFLKNNGSGTFTDVTDNILVGYDVNAQGSYYPKILDLNNDGLKDILVSGANGLSTQFLLKSTDGKYVSAHRQIVQDFMNQIRITSGSDNPSNTVNLIQDPSGNTYLVSAVSFMNGSDRQLSVYASQLGSPSTTTAQAAVDLLQQQWPYMTTAAADSVLTQSSLMSLNGVAVIGDAAIFRPIGQFWMPVNSKLMSLSGSVSGLKLNGQADMVKVFDSTGRDFTIDYSLSSFQSTSFFASNIDNIDDDTRSAQFNSGASQHYAGWKLISNNETQSIAVGYRAKINHTTTMNFQYSQLPFNPFVQLSGSWGTVKGTNTMETSITKRDGSWVTRFGAMYTQTSITPGLVTRVNPITSMWAEAGIETKNFKLYGGVMPYVVSGSADLNIPTTVNSKGQVGYSSTSAKIANLATPYARISYTNQLSNKVSYRVNALATAQKQHSVTAELKIKF
jgi:hypothetical protein